MERDQAKEAIKRRIPVTEYLTKSKNGLYCCPYCGSGTGPHASGAVKVYPETNTFYCHACGKGGDVIDLYQQETGKDYKEALSLMAADIGIEIDRQTAGSPPADQGKESRPAAADQAGKKGSSAGKAGEPAQQQEGGSADYSSYYMDCINRITSPAAAAYLSGRGISVETAAAYGIGYDPEADPANAPGGQGEKKHPEARIIIPTGKAHYIGRAIRADIEGAWAKMNPKGSSPGLFNGMQLDQSDSEVFITEGAFDCLSLLELETPAIALNSANNAERFIERLKEKKPAATLVLCMDNDKAGQKATETLKQGLRQLEIPFICANIAGSYKDINDRMQGDRSGLLEAIKEARQQCAKKPDNISSYLKQEFMSEISSFKCDIKTGFPDLDQKSGGLYSGLYILAATPSLGKTTLLNQIGDQIAFAGHDVLYFSLEQSRLEMVTKSLARLTAQKDPETAVSSLSIRKGYLPQQVMQAMQEYQERAGDHISIIEGNFSCSASFIGGYIRRYIARNDVKPVVIIDYLQILQPEEINGRQQTTKETVDNTVTTLKRISRDLDITVIAISSVNRANYLFPIDFEALKESGNLEFTADVIWGLQLNCLTSNPAFESFAVTDKREIVKEARAANPRKIDLVCLKNRYGIANYSCSFDYYPGNDVFYQIDPLPDQILQL